MLVTAALLVLSLYLLCEKALAWTETPANLVKQYGGATLKTSALKPKASLDWTVTWGIDKAAGKIYFAIEAGTSGWVGLGLTEAAGMRGADIMVAHVNASGSYVADYHAIGNQLPIMDGCQDWSIHHGEEANGQTLVVVSRKVLTQDSNDRPILLTGLLRNGLLAAFGSSDTLAYHNANKVKFAVNLDTGAAADQSSWSAAKAADGTLTSFVLKTNEGSTPPSGTVDKNYKAPESGGGQLLGKERTMYWEYCFMDRSSWDHSKFMTAFESVSDGSPANVHHFVLYGFDQDGCHRDALETIVWVGGIGFYEDMPTGTALSFGRLKSFRLQVHYDNPSGSAGLRDNSGVRIWLSSQTPTHEAGTLQLGDGQLQKMGTPIPRGRSHFQWTCPGSETSSWPTDITVFASILHMHEKGDQMYTQLTGSGGVVSKPNSVEFFDFAHQDPTLVQPYTIKKGDTLTTRCYYNNDRTALDDPLWFGLGSDQEMCIDFLYYYPFNPNFETHCKSTFDGMVQITNSSDPGMRSFGVDAGTPSDPRCTGGANLSAQVSLWTPSPPSPSPSPPSPSPSPSPSTSPVAFVPDAAVPAYTFTLPVYMVSSVLVLGALRCS